MIAPCILQAATLLLWTYCGLPAISIPESIATTVYHATAREAHKLWLQVSKSLCQIFSQAMTHVCILWHQRHHINIHDALCQHENLQHGFLAVSIWNEDSIVFLPVSSIGSNESLCQQLWLLTLLWLNKDNAYLLCLAIVTQEDREVILRATLHTDAAKAAILNAIAFPAFIVVELLHALCCKAHIGRVVRMNTLIHLHLQEAQRMSWAYHLP